MSSPDPKRLRDNFEKLTRQERVILSYLCEGLAREQIAERLSITRDGLRTHLHNIYKKLEAEGGNEEEKRKYLGLYYRQFVAPHKKKTEPQNVTSTPPNVPNEPPNALNDQVNAPETLPNGSRRPRWVWIVTVGAFVLSIICVGIACFTIPSIFSRLVSGRPTQTQVAMIPTEFPTVAIPLEVLTVRPTATPRPTDTPVPTDIPTDTPTPTVTFTPRPSNTPEAVLFFDSFEGADVSPQWNKIKGSYYIQDGMLTSKDAAEFSIAAPSGNYGIKVHLVNTGGGSVVISPFTNGINDKAGLLTLPYSMRWYLQQPPHYEDLTESVDISTPDTDLRMELVNGVATVYIAGQKITSMSRPGYSLDQVVLQVDESGIDDFTFYSLP